MKKIILTVIFAAFIAISMTACSGSNESNKVVESQTSEHVEDSSSTTELDLNSDPEVSESASDSIFESDEIVNQLLNSYNEIAEYKIEPQNIKQGNIKTKAIVSFDNFYMEIVNSNRGFVCIEITDSQASNDSLYSVFRDFICAINNDISENDIETAWDDIQHDYYEIDYNDTGYLEVYELEGIQLQYLAPSNISNETNINMLYKIEQ